MPLYKVIYVSEAFVHAPNPEQAKVGLKFHGSDHSAKAVVKAVMEQNPEDNPKSEFSVFGCYFQEIYHEDGMLSMGTSFMSSDPLITGVTTKMIRVSTVDTLAEPLKEVIVKIARYNFDHSDPRVIAITQDPYKNRHLLIGLFAERGILVNNLFVVNSDMEIFIREIIDGLISAAHRFDPDNFSAKTTLLSIQESFLNDYSIRSLSLNK